MGILAYLARYGLTKAIQRFGKAAVNKARKLEAKVEAKLDKAQGIRRTTPGRTAPGRGAVVGKRRTKVYGRTKKIVGAGAGAAVGGAAAGVGAYKVGRSKGKSEREKLQKKNARLRKEVTKRRKEQKGFPFKGK